MLVPFPRGARGSWSVSMCFPSDAPGQTQWYPPWNPETQLLLCTVAWKG